MNKCKLIKMHEFGCLGYLIDNKYTIISEYGSGRQGIIYEVSRIPDNTRYALKVVNIIERLMLIK
jgi:hypothetical protein